MNASGVVVGVVGVWLLCQILGGNALGRLGITGAPTQQAAAPPVTGPEAPGAPHVQVPPGMTGG